jgi:D-serine dehydratase
MPAIMLPPWRRAVPAEADPNSYFVDDEHSLPLLLGYAAAAAPLRTAGGAGRNGGCRPPLFVYLPCGVGGAPGGIAHGLKLLFGPHVHCFLPSRWPRPACWCSWPAAAMRLSVYDIGLDNRTEADGLAVGLAPLVAPLMRAELSGVFTVGDDDLFRLRLQVEDHCQLALEPSAQRCAGRTGCAIARQGRLIWRHMACNSSWRMPIMWCGLPAALVPPEEHQRFRQRGLSLAG